MLFCAPETNILKKERPEFKSWYLLSYEMQKNCLNFPSVSFSKSSAAQIVH